MPLRLKPEKREFFDLFTKAAENAQEIARVLVELVGDWPASRDRLSDVRELEHEGDRLTSEVITLLTLVSTVFIPLTFLVGIWGMNFDPDSSPWNMPELRAYYGYPLAIGFMLIVALFLVLYFRWKKWL